MFSVQVVGEGVLMLKLPSLQRGCAQVEPRYARPLEVLTVFSWDGFPSLGVGLSMGLVELPEVNSFGDW